MVVKILSFIKCRERADLFTLLCVVFCAFVTFPIGVPGRVWYLVLLYTYK